MADRVHSAAIHLLRHVRKQDDAIGVTASRLSALSVVVFAGPVTIGRLAAAEQVSPPTMTRMLAGMERDGLVRRERDQRDGRVIWINATPRGTRLLGEARRRRVATLATKLAAFSAPDLDLLTRAARLIERVVASPTGHETVLPTTPH